MRNGSEVMRGNNDQVIQLFEGIIAVGEEIRSTCKRLYFSGNKKSIPPDQFEAWKMNCLSLLKSTFGASSPYYDGFVSLKFFDYYNSTQIYLGILKGAREDLLKGYFFHKDLMLSVNIYYALTGRALQSAAEGDGRKAAAVLEATLTEVLVKICENRKVPCGPEDGIEELANRLGSSGMFEPGACREIEERRTLLAAAVAGERLEEVEVAARWLQEFLNEYLGSRIMILN